MFQFLLLFITLQMSFDETLHLCKVVEWDVVDVKRHLNTWVDFIRRKPLNELSPFKWNVLDRNVVRQNDANGKTLTIDRESNVVIDGDACDVVVGVVQRRQGRQPDRSQTASAALRNKCSLWIRGSR